MQSERQSEKQSEVSAAFVSETTAVPILEFGRAWMSSPLGAERAAALGLAPGFGIWLLGRAGALGDVSADVAAGAIGFMAPAMVRSLWEARPSDLAPSQVTVEYAAFAAEFGRGALAGVAPARLERLAELSNRVISNANPCIGMLFAGWRGVSQPDDPAGRATIALQVLRELRGGAHLSAVQAAGIGPHGAIISADDQVRGGVAGATRFGWPEPHPAVDKVARAEAERLTTAIVTPVFEVLTGLERAEFVDLVAEARATLD